MSYNSVTITVNNIQYTLKADIDPLVLGQAVKIVDDRIAIYKRSSEKDELRSAVMAALSLAIEISKDSDKIEETVTHNIKLKENSENLMDELEFSKDELKNLIVKIDNSLGSKDSTATKKDI